MNRKHDMQMMRDLSGLVAESVHDLYDGRIRQLQTRIKLDKLALYRAMNNDNMKLVAELSDKIGNAYKLLVQLRYEVAIADKEAIELIYDQGENRPV